MADARHCAGAVLGASSDGVPPFAAALAVGIAVLVLLAAALITWRLQCRPAAAAAAAAAAKALDDATAAALPAGQPPPPATPDPSPPQPIAALQAAQAAAAAALAPLAPAQPQQQQALPPLPPPLSLPALPRRLVRATLPDGEHHVRFGDGSAYYGEWRGGRMHGRGVFVWPSGERYEGEWADGQESGTATFAGAEGGTYYGSWLGGQMHGKCVYRPAAADAAGPHVVYLQQYDHGRLVSQQVLRVAEKDIRKRQQKKEGKKKAKRAAKQRYVAPKPGEPVYKGHRSYDLMRELQLGITFSIAQAGLAAASGELREADFSQETTQHFPPGAETGPFKWKDYAPRVFHRLREAFGIDNIDYLLSLTGEAALRLLASPGKSGSAFFLSDDDRFLVKTVRKQEMRLLLSLIPHYYRHVQANPGTLLTRFYGVHRLTPIIGRQVRFIVMGNVLPSDLRLHRRYDLKGSTYGRTVGAEERATNPHATLKDEDLDMQLILPQRAFGGVLRQLRRDLDLLERLYVIDYSLLLGVHFTRWGDAAWHPPFRDWPAELEAAAAVAQGSEGTATRPVTPVGAAVVAGAAGGADATAAGGPGVAPAAAGEAAARGAVPWQLSLSEGSSAAASPTSPASPTASFVAVQPATAGPARAGTLTSKLLLRQGSVDAADELAALLEGLLPLHLGAAAADAAASGEAAGQPEEARAAGPAAAPPADALQEAAATVVQAAFQSRQQARLSATAALQSVACSPSSVGSQSLPSIAEAGSPAGPVLGLIGEGSGEDGPAAAVRSARRSTLPPPAASPAAPLVAVADRSDPGHWWLDRACGLQASACFSGSAAEAGDELGERWAQRPLPPGEAAAGEAQQCILLGSGGLASAGGALEPAAVARLGRLLSRRDSGEHESAGRAVPAVAVRRSAGGALQLEPVLLFFGIIDFLQDYTLRKHLERWWKAAVHDGGAVSVADPRFYSRRFWQAMQRLLLSSDGGGPAAAAAATAAVAGPGRHPD